MKANQIQRLVLRGYKSIAHCEIELGRMNVLIGANGSGKSNFIGFFRLINRIMARQLQLAVSEMGGPDALLHFGRKKTEALEAALHFGNQGHSYTFMLRPTQDNRMVFAFEDLWCDKYSGFHLHAAHFETRYKDEENNGKENKGNVWEYLVPAMRGWRLYHFHDTGPGALLKQVHNLNDNEYLRDDARNLAAFLFRLKRHHLPYYQRIVKTIQLVAPFFGDFHLRPTPDNPDTIQLEWTEAGQDIPFAPSALSDGSLRFICLATLLLQPASFIPSTLLIDEPELGLHPFALSVLAGLMKSASAEHQLIVSTQSVELLNAFEAENLIVVDRQAQASVFRRLNVQALGEWLAEYSLGELWKKNLLGGRAG